MRYVISAYLLVRPRGTWFPLKEFPWNLVVDPSLYPVPGQQEPTLHVTAPVDHNTTMQTPNTLTDVSNRQRQHLLTSTSEDEDDTHHNSNNEWQVIRRTKGKKIHSHHSQPRTP